MLTGLLNSQGAKNKKRVIDNINRYADLYRLYTETLEKISMSDPGLATRIAAADFGGESLQKNFFADRIQDIALAKAKAVLTYIASNNYTVGEIVRYYWHMDPKANPADKWQDESMPRAL